MAQPTKMTIPILSILNPAHIPTDQDICDIAEMLSKDNTQKHSELNQLKWYRKLIQRWEELVRGKWEIQTVVNNSGRDSKKCEFPKLHNFYKSGSIVYCKNCSYRTEDKQVFQPALLKKSHFVCEVEKPKNPFNPNAIDFANELFEYESAKEKVWFEGFENGANRVIKTEGLSIVFEKRYLTMRFAYDNVIEIANCTVYDLIYMIDRYNRTASTPIELNFTPAFVNQLLQ